MINNINKYETIFVVDASLEEEKITALVEKFKSLISDAGEIESVDEWGKRRLAYPIDDKNEGYYVLIHFSAQPDFPQELERIYRITDGILRDIIIKKEEKRKISK
ncbi:MAG: 30S ribosomal protein S6 [Clostridia bacterium]|nr:30S ribosomal protein S6 [Clostridia bacterium]